MERNIVFRKGKIEDAVELHLLFIETISTVCAADYNSLQIEAWIANRKDIEPWQETLQNEFVLVAQQQNKIVGFATLKQGSYLNLFYVHRNYQRQGIAKQLLAKIEEEVRQLKEKTITADVSITAKAFFEQADFSLLQEQL
jgi:putative acetyltransferase